jgi:DNA-binding transcriptional regulator YiaG
MPLTKPTASAAASIKKVAIKPKPAVKTAAKRPVKAAVAVKKPIAKPALKKPAVAKKPAAAAKKPASTLVKTTAAKPVVKPAVKAPEAPKIKKIKQIRDSFTMPEPEYAVIAQVKKACLKAGFEMKKSDLLRIGVSLIKGLDISTLKIILATLTPLKAGRPKK